MSARLGKPAVMDVQRPAQPTDIMPTAQLPVTNASPAGLEVPQPLPEQPQQPQTIQQPKIKGGKGPIVAIILIVFVVLLLIGGAVFYYLRSRASSGTVPITQAPAAQIPVADDGYTDPADIDATVQKIDGALTNLNDSTDFGASDLNDSTIGL